MFRFPKFHPFPVTDPALITAVAAMVISVLKRALVTARTMGPAFINLGRMIWRQPDMLSSGDRSQMSWITTTTCLAGVMQMQLRWAKEELPDDSMDIDRTLGPTNNSVTETPNVARPEPAPRIWLRTNLFLQTLWERRQFYVHDSTPVWPKGCAGAIFL